MYMINMKNLLGIHVSSSETNTSFFSNNISLFDFVEKNEISSFAFLVPKNLSSTYGFHKNSLINAFAHSSFAHNPSSLEKEKREYSHELLIKEAVFCQEINVGNLVFHPGSNLFKNDEEKRIQSLNNICVFLEKYCLKNINTKLLLENSCGSGSQLFSDTRDFKYIFDNISSSAKDKIGICLDTCHLFQSGFDVSKKEVFLDIFNTLQNISNNKVLLFHLNNSKHDIGCHLDRHEKISLGKIDKRFFSHVSEVSIKYEIPMILETPSNSYERIEERKMLLDIYDL